MRITKSISLLIMGFSLMLSCKESQKAELIITNAKIWTGSEKQPAAQAMAISGDSILAVGTNEEIQHFNGSSTEVVDIQGGFITPGFIDTHVHLLGGGNGLLSVKLTDAKTPEEFTKRIAEYAKTVESGTWIMEGNWDHTLWGGALPTKEWIDRETKENPVFVYRLDGHMALANNAAMKLAGIDKNSKDVAGGEIVRDKKGEPTGIFKDNAMNLILDQVPPFTEAQKLKAFKAATQYFLSNGVTSVHDVNGMNNSYESYSIAKQLNDANELSVRVYAIAPLSGWKQLAGMEPKVGKWMKTGGLKGFVDGSLGSHTAAFKDVYTDKPMDKGFFINTSEDLYQWVSNADKVGLHVMVHAIGDSAIHSLLDIYKRVEQENGKKDRRFRIEHAQHLAPADINRFAELGVIASMQPYHAIDDGRWAEQLIGPERIKTTYAFKSLLDSKAVVSFGSDWPVAPSTPLEGIYAAVTRSTLDDKNPDGWVPEQKITVEQALIGYTRSGAYASFDENIKGTLEPGKLADFVVISEDLTKVDPIRIRELKVLLTYVGGKKVYDYKGN
ncbi:MAG: amidohydrolase [Cyclobacteriaceae bacterium]|nr:amidohydrolase [Cyclobacteriaceae bacterium]